MRRLLLYLLAASVLMPSGARAETYYYNPASGKRYHADGQCPAVDPLYLPLATFDASELQSEPYSSLQKCRVCEPEAEREENGGGTFLLYYNPQGGKFYHLRENCESVGAAYLPLTAFDPSDADEALLERLSACPVCHGGALTSVYGEPALDGRYHLDALCPLTATDRLAEGAILPEQLADTPFDALAPCPLCCDVRCEWLFYDPAEATTYHKYIRCPEAGPDAGPLTPVKSVWSYKLGNARACEACFGEEPAFYADASGRFHLDGQCGSAPLEESPLPQAGPAELESLTPCETCCYAR